MQRYIKERKAHLKQCELEFFKKYMDKNRSFIERNVHELSFRQLHARRSELEILQEHFKTSPLLTNLEQKQLVENSYDLCLQNLSPRCTENEAFLEGIKIGVHELLEFLQSQQYQYIQKE